MAVCLRFGVVAVRFVLVARVGRGKGRAPDMFGSFLHYLLKLGVSHGRSRFRVSLG